MIYFQINRDIIPVEGSLTNWIRKYSYLIREETGLEN